MGNRGLVFNAYNISTGEDGRFLEMMAVIMVMVYDNMNVLNVIELYT